VQETDFSYSVSMDRVNAMLKERRMSPVSAEEFREFCVKYWMHVETQVPTFVVGSRLIENAKNNQVE
jgi:hypothetical protein